ncbi:hypothetical protein Pla110_16390 [Polystyrenella longa]|uniref:Uncharacterized protein n=1 Tax=Polystyrenella longa TaxID=2528007 RepID=A0A518CL23_9PLAN|nr:DUF6655 family protein [Polystyrenella longa]QDU79919.1 hypothetical protein Pla110_16390 [Polystyrenella longa]
MAASSSETPFGCFRVGMPLSTLILYLFLLAGCGTTISRNATDQLTASDSVDRAIASIDFTPLAGRKVFLDTTYIVPVKTIDYVNKEYIVSTIRQQIIGAGCYLQETKDEADLVVEARVGTMGADGHEIIYGIPPNNFSTVASSMIPGAPSLPAIPEMAFMKKNSHSASSKIGVFAYDRTTREAVWQSGLSKSESTAKNMWVFGAGPFQRGEIYDGTKFAGSKLQIATEEEQGVVKISDEIEQMHSRKTFKQNKPPEGLLLSQGTVRLVALNSDPVAVGELTVIDQDSNDHHEFQLVEGEGGEDNSLFQIRERTLELKPEIDLQQLEKEMLHVRISVRDAVSEYQQWFEIPIEKEGIQLLSSEQEQKNGPKQQNDEPANTEEISSRRVTLNKTPPPSDQATQNNTVPPS